MARTEYAVTRQLANRTDFTESCNIPGLRLSVAELQACVDDARENGGFTMQLWCDTCGESVADCIELAGKLSRVPAAWSWQAETETA